MNILSQVLHSYLNALQQLRANPQDLAAYVYCSVTDAQGTTYDGNAQQRYRLLLALLADGQAEDEGLLKQLLQAEIKAHQQDVDQGLSDAMRLNVFLLIRFDNPSHLKWLIQAKSANFDSSHEFNEKFFLWYGHKRSYNRVKKLDKPLQQVFYQAVGKTRATSVFNETEINTWKTRLTEFYATYLTTEDFDREFHLLLDLGEKESALLRLQLWQREQQVHDKAYWGKLANLYRYLADVPGEMAAYQAVLPLCANKKEHLEVLITLGDLYQQQQDTEGLWACIQTYQSMPSKVAQLGLWSSNRIDNQCLALILQQQDARHPQTKIVWKWLKRRIKGQKNMSSHRLESVAQAYALMGKAKKSARYHAKAQQAQLKWPS